MRRGALEFVISSSGSDEKSARSLALLGTWISPCGRNDIKVKMTGNSKCAGNQNEGKSE